MHLDRGCAAVVVARWAARFEVGKVELGVPFTAIGVAVAHRDEERRIVDLLLLGEHERLGLLEEDVREDEEKARDQQVGRAQREEEDAEDLVRCTYSQCSPFHHIASHYIPHHNTFYSSPFHDVASHCTTS